MYFTTFLICACLLHLGLAGYILEDDYSTDKFFSMFNFETGDDLNGGYVNYVDQPTAESGGLINTNNGQVYIGVDHTNQATGRGRSSVRIESRKQYTHGLVVLDLEHMPGGICGTWPAFWTYGPTWPNSGEIDIIEGVNDQSTNSMTLHTGADCAISNINKPQVFAAQNIGSNCDVDANDNQGCSFAATSTLSYGAGFNSNRGGVYAMEWTSAAIRTWFWPRGTAPPDILGSSPTPSNWSTPQAYFAGGCNIDQHFMNNWIVFDNTFCGSWAGNAWGGDCAATNGNSCQDFVQTTPSAFQNAYWLINSLKVYQESGASDTEGTTIAAASAAPSSVAGPVSSSRSTRSSQPITSTKPAPSSQAMAPTSSSKLATFISAPVFVVSTTVSSISLPHTSTMATSTLATSTLATSTLATSTLATSTLATSTLATSTMTLATSISTSVAVLSPVSSSSTERTTVAESPTQDSSPEAIPTDLLLWDEFGKGSKGIPEFADIPQRRRHARHLQDHVRRAKTHI